MNEPVRITREVDLWPKLEERFPYFSCEVKRDPEEPLLFHHRVVRLGELKVHATGLSHEARVIRREYSDSLSICCLLSGVVSVKEAREKSPVEFGDRDMSIYWHREGRVVDLSRRGGRYIIEVPRELFQSVVLRHYGIDIDARPHFEPAVPAVQPLCSLIRHLAEAALAGLLDDSTPHARVLAGQFRDLIVTTLLAGTQNSLSVTLLKASSPATTRHIRRALDFIEANLENVISIEMLAGAAGCTPRTLQLGFRDHLGTTPLAMLKKRRLEEAENRLKSGQYGTVT
jgi:hypothetical protein